MNLFLVALIGYMLKPWPDVSTISGILFFSMRSALVNMGGAGGGSSFDVAKTNSFLVIIGKNLALHERK